MDEGDAVSDADVLSTESGSGGTKPLSDLTVIDLTSALAGPYGTLLLAGLGARVIKIEHPEGGDRVRQAPPFIGEDGTHIDRHHAEDMSVGFMNRARNKLSITLDLKQPQALEVYADLVRKADVVVENFSRGTSDRLGVGYSFCSSINPRIVFCALSGFGAEGEAGAGKAFDAIIQALSGVMMASGMPGDPPIKMNFPLADLITPLFGVIGILSAVHRAQRTGRGEFVDVSMLGAMTSLMACEPFATLERAGIPMRTGNSVPRLAPFGIFQSADGYIALAAGDARMFASLAEAMGQPEIATDERFRDKSRRTGNYAELDALIEAWTKTRTTDELVEELDRRNVPVGPVRYPQDAVVDPRVLERGETVRIPHPIFGEIEDVYGPGIPIVFSDSDVGLDRPAPLLGEHNLEIFQDFLGYSDEKLKHLEHDGVI
jgi:crotonobetainyl-CoA:carnitine CoA-transferase CaiB-like acyl-CoA transferase